MASHKEHAQSLLHGADGGECLEWSRNEQVPAWARDASALKIVKKVSRSQSLLHMYSEELVCGPAIPAAFKANLVLWVPFIVIPMVAFPFSTCGSDGMGQYPRWLWLVVLPTLMASSWYELTCLRYVLPAYVVTDGPFRILVKLPFYVWFFIASGLSLLAKLNLFTSGLFVVELWRTGYCSPQFENIWHVVLSESMFAGIGWLAEIELRRAALALWLLMLLIPLYALAVSVPIEIIETHVGVEFGYTLKESAAHMGEDTTGVVDHYRTVALARTSHGASLQSLAESAGMASVTYGNWRYRMKTNVNFGVAHWRLIIEREIVRFTIVSLVHNALWINLQASVLAVARASDPQHHIDLETVFAVAIGLASAMHTLLTHISKILGMWRVARQTAEFAGAQEDLEILGRMDLMMYTFVAIAACAIFFFSYCAIKVFMATFVCPEGVWNIGGCVDVDA